MKKIILLAVLALTLAAGSVFAGTTNFTSAVNYFGVTGPESPYGEAIVVGIYIGAGQTESRIVFPLEDTAFNQRLADHLLTTLAIAKTTGSTIDFTIEVDNAYIYKPNVPALKIYKIVELTVNQ